MRSISRLLLCAALSFVFAVPLNAQEPSQQTRTLQILQEQLLNTEQDFNQLRDASSPAAEKALENAAERLSDSAANAHTIVTAASDLIIVSRAVTCAADRAKVAGLVSARWVQYGGTLQSLGRSVDRELSVLATTQSTSEIAALARRYRTQLTEIEKLLRTAMLER